MGTYIGWRVNGIPKIGIAFKVRKSVLHESFFQISEGQIQQIRSATQLPFPTHILVIDIGGLLRLSKTFFPRVEFGQVIPIVPQSFNICL